MNGLKWLLNMLQVVHVYLLASHELEAVCWKSEAEDLWGRGKILARFSIQPMRKDQYGIFPPFSLLEESALFARCVFPPFRNAAIRDDDTGTPWRWQWPMQQAED